MRFDPTTGKEILEKSLTSQFIDFLTQYAIDMINFGVSLAALILAVSIYLKWTEDESKKLLMFDVKNVKREIYHLVAREILLMAELRDVEIEKIKVANHPNQKASDTLKKNQARVTKEIADYRNRALDYGCNRNSITDEAYDRTKKNFPVEGWNDGARRLRELSEDIKNLKIQNKAEEIQKLERIYNDKAVEWKKLELENIKNIEKRIKG